MKSERKLPYDAIIVRSDQSDGAWADVVEVAKFLGRTEYHSGVAALCAMARQSRIYKDACELIGRKPVRTTRTGKP